MKGVFQSGDLLLIDELKFEDLKKGDVVVFNDPREISKDSLIIHRIINIQNGEITTRGDSNKGPDVLPVNNSNFVGKVSKYERKGKSHKVRGGLTGLYLTRSKYFFRRILILIYMNLIRFKTIKSLGRLMLSIFNSYIIRINFSSPGGIITKWVLNRKVIARKGPEKGDFYCQKPFDLIIENQKSEVRSKK